ncbi:MAG: ATP synthase F1 subunit delta [Bacteroidales bacterium]|nr:ATP synthase F1 subunit delta [Bacteroidales bacterium]
MNQSTIAVRYAKALFMLAQEKQQLEAVAKDMETLLLIEKDNETLAQLYQNPVLNIHQKQAIFKDLFEKHFNATTMQFLSLIVTNRREKNISNAARNFLKRYREHLGIKKAFLTTASDMNNTQKEIIVKLVKEAYKAEVEMDSTIDNNLLGGFVLQVDDTRYDASIATQLKNIKQQLLS